MSWKLVDFVSVACPGHCKATHGIFRPKIQDSMGTKPIQQPIQ